MSSPDAVITALRTGHESLASTRTPAVSASRPDVTPSTDTLSATATPGLLPTPRLQHETDNVHY
jgi:hypothetical protein